MNDAGKASITRALSNENDGFSLPWPHPTENARLPSVTMLKSSASVNPESRVDGRQSEPLQGAETFSDAHSVVFR
tara:strand:- start:10942 stop:11166 length:225 start_codon:yes stop_codon:yes gene_type:complete